MKPIRDRAEVAFSEALRCVEYRLPTHTPMRKRTLNLSLSLRYGLVASSALMYLHDLANFGEGFEAKPHIEDWPHRVAAHFRGCVQGRLPYRQSEESADLIGRQSLIPLRLSVALRRQGIGISSCLECAAESFYREFRFQIFSEYWWMMNRKATRIFADEMQRSVCYALNFYERRHYDLEELPEIALIGE